MLGSYRVFSTARRRVLCSLDELRTRNGSAIKFPLVASSEPPADGTKRPGKAARGGRTGFVFFCETTQAPRAFVNRYDASTMRYEQNDAVLVECAF
jgi:hypothetical protein